jgi:molybdopterin/thiamine biosynthesis adenylyltransferase
MQHYLIIGAGGTASLLLPQLLVYLDAKHDHKRDDYLVVIFDGDDFEPKNADRQLFDPTYITVNKAVTMEQMYNTRYPVIGRPKFLSRTDLDDVMQDGDIVFICADNYTIRAHIEDRALQMNDVTIINGGNEKYDGSVQLFIRENGLNATPRLSFAHPEIAPVSGDDRSEMTCAQAAALPGGEQLIVANATAATTMLTALWRYDNDLWRLSADQTPDRPTTWTEYQFDLLSGEYYGIDQRRLRNWK